NVNVVRGAASPAHLTVMPVKATPGRSSALTVQSAPTYDMCLQDDSNGSTLSLNTTTGDYIFTCGNCVKKIGTGTLSVMGCTVTLSHNPSDRRVTASVNKCTRTGTASLQSPPGTTQCSIRDTNRAAESCSTDLTPPQVGITAPNGGEIVDTGSAFT